MAAMSAKVATGPGDSDRFLQTQKQPMLRFINDVQEGYADISAVEAKVSEQKRLFRQVEAERKLEAVKN
jgi:hypothetical protein